MSRLAAAAAGSADRVSREIVAFPHHGPRAGAVVPLMREAMAAGGDIVGGIDPGRTELNIHTALETTFQPADDVDARSTST